MFGDDRPGARAAGERDEGAAEGAPSMLRDSFARAAERLSVLDRDCCINPDDRGHRAIMHFIGSVRGFDILREDELEYVLLTLPIPSNKGNKENWRPADACAEQKGIFKELAALQEIERMRSADGVRARLEAFFEAFLTFVEAKKHASGTLDFDDLLIKVRELCKDPDALDRLRERYRYILVDEFQDTDPVQAEIIYLLAGSPGSRDRLAPEPGKLFIVGDPKQSIYRFRKADVEMYERVKERLSSSGARLSITQNFRSVPGLIEWVNDTFSGIMLPPEEGAFQPRYEPIHPRRPEGEAPAVVLFDLELGEEDALAENVRRREGEAVARLIRRLLEDAFVVMDTRTKEMRPVQYGDIAVMYPGTTGIDHYEAPLRADRIPYIVEGGKLFYAREEIRDLASVIWAVEDPYDALALVGSLRSPMFGFSDEELFLFTRRGGRLKYLDPGAEALETNGDLAAACNLLAELHAHRNELGPARTITELLHRTKYMELSLLRPHGEQRVSNIKKALSSARSFEGKRHSYRRFARWFRDQEMLASPESESPVVEEGENAVRLLTVHKAKGLQFPVVILANLIQSKKSSSRILVERGKNLSFKLGALLETSDHATAAERERLREAAETVRLLYVAATRAGDMLIIPQMPKEGSYFDLIKSHLCGSEARLCDGAADGRRRPAAGEGEREAHARYGAVWKLSELPPLRGESRPFVRFGVCSREQRRRSADERAAWIGARKNLLEHARRAPLVLAPSRLAGEAIVQAKNAEVFEAPGARGAVSRDRSLLFGQAFHRIMELADFSGRLPVSDLAAAVAAELGIEEETRELERCAASALGSEIMRRAARAERLFREVPFMLRIGEHFIEGRIDLLFREAGRWTLVDYKTDDRPGGGTDDKLAAYRLQAGLYARALEQFGMACSGVELYFARSNSIITIEYSSGLRTETERLIREAGLTRASGRAPSTGNRLEA
jgi:ATP-dependent helicase/nuclease subunit A